MQIYGAYTQPSGEGGAQVNVIFAGRRGRALAEGPDRRPAMSHEHGEGLPNVDATKPAVLVLPGPVAKDEVPRLCTDVGALLRATGAGVVVCDVAGIGTAGLAAVDVLARLQLAARRAGGRIRLRGPDPALSALLGVVGLAFEVEGQPEEREQAVRVEEAVEPGDPAV